ncbi:response regulator [Winogradskyella sp. PC D3.3]
MKKHINVLLVDDHPAIIQAYSVYLDIFKESNPNYELHVLTAMCCDSAIEIIKTNALIDVALLDMQLPKSKDRLFKSGEDLGVLLKRKFPRIKIIIITGYYETLVLSSVLQRVKPKSMLLKGDITAQILIEAFTKVLLDERFYSSSVLELIHKKISSSISLDALNKIMLYELWKGTKTKDLVSCLPLSIGAIEKRKRQIKSLFNAEGKDDETLIKIVLEEGFL